MNTHRSRTKYAHTFPSFSPTFCYIAKTRVICINQWFNFSVSCQTRLRWMHVSHELYKHTHSLHSLTGKLSVTLRKSKSSPAFIFCLLSESNNNLYSESHLTRREYRVSQNFGPNWENQPPCPWDTHYQFSIKNELSTRNPEPSGSPRHCTAAQCQVIPGRISSANLGPIQSYFSFRVSATEPV